MKIRLYFARFLIRLGQFIQDLPVFLLPARDLVRFGQYSYSKAMTVQSWNDPNLVDYGLYPIEKIMFEQLPQKGGNMLLLGLGGGREAIVFAHSGYQVTGVDFVKDMVDLAVQNGRRHGVEIRGNVKDIRDLDYAPDSFDVVWFSCSIYSSIPGKKTRIESLRRVGESLKSNGRVICMFYWNPAVQYSRLKWVIGKLIAWISFGNRQIEQGDILKDNREFLHAFYDREQLKMEFAKSGFDIVDFYISDNSHNAGAILKRSGKDRI